MQGISCYKGSDQSHFLPLGFIGILNISDQTNSLEKLCCCEIPSIYIKLVFFLLMTCGKEVC